MNQKKVPAHLVPSELIPALRLSKPLPLPKDESSHIYIVHGEEYACIGYLVCRFWRGENNYHGFVTGMEKPNREYFIFTPDLAEASRLASLDEASLKNACQMPGPEG